MSELDLIRDGFTGIGTPRSDVILGVGDDCALLEVPAGQQLAISIDTLAAGTHFLADCDPALLGHKSLAVGLSDLAAMGAEPAWATLALTLPDHDPRWVAAFSRGFAALAKAHGVSLVGGDTTRGPLSVTVQVHGLVPAGQAIRRSGAAPGDLVYVSGTLGDAGLALRQLLAGTPADSFARGRLERPTPRVELGLALRGIASAMIDLSDGLAADLGHILAASGAGAGAEIELAALPMRATVASAVQADGDWTLPLASGDDYELCFCVPPSRLAELSAAARGPGVAVTRVGRIIAGSGLRCLGPDGDPIALGSTGFDHFPDRQAG